MAIRTSYIKCQGANKTSTFLGHLKVKDAGVVTVSVDGTGNGTQDVTFNMPFTKTPAVLLTAQEADTTGILSVSNSSKTGFTINVTGTSASDSLDVAWLAVESA